MIIIERSGALVGDVLDDIRRLENLLAHLKCLVTGQYPSAEEIAAAPAIEQYRLALRADPCLEGSIVGRPAPLSYTSALWTYAPSHGWARSLSRLYRLGHPYGADDRQMH